MGGDEEEDYHDDEDYCPNCGDLGQCPKCDSCGEPSCGCTCAYEEE